MGRDLSAKENLTDVLFGESEEARYREILVEIAKKYQALMAYTIDWKRRVPIILPKPYKKGLFRPQMIVPKEVQEKEQLLRELEDLQSRAAARKASTGRNGRYDWWNISWQKLEQYLLYDLVESEQSGKWQFTRKWYSADKDGVKLLILDEEGHYSSFDTGHDVDICEESPYTESERSELMKSYRNRVRSRELNAIMMYNDCLIHSEWTNKTYRSMTDYVTSAERYIVRDYYESEYQSSLSETHQKNITRVISNSIHYHCIYAVAGYLVLDNHWLDGWGKESYQVIDSKGTLPPAIVEQRQTKNSIVACAAFLANLPELKIVTLSALGKNVLNGTALEQEAIECAEIAACLAHKLQKFM